MSVWIWHSLQVASVNKYVDERIGAIDVDYNEGETQADSAEVQVWSPAVAQCASQLAFILCVHCFGQLVVLNNKKELIGCVSVQAIEYAYRIARADGRSQQRTRALRRRSGPMKPQLGAEANGLHDDASCWRARCHLCPDV